MPTRRSAPSSYRAAQAAARHRIGVVEATTLRRVEDALARFRADLLRGVGGLSGATRAQAEAMVARLSRTLGSQLERIASQGRGLAYDLALAEWDDATGDALRTLGLSVMTRVPPVRMLNAFDAVGSAATWRTLLRGHVADAAAEASAIVSGAIVQGVSPAELATRLRPYLEGSRPFRSAFTGATGLDPELLRDPRHRNALRRLRHDAERIAFTELQNARGEAEVAAFAVDPLIEAVAWRLAPDRGTQVSPDVCDAMAEGDYFGLGPGVYPVDKVPVTPHPWDRCERVPIVRPTRDPAEPKPTPGLVEAPFSRLPARVTRLPARDRTRIAEQLADNLVTSGSLPAGAAVREAVEDVARVAARPRVPPLADPVEVDRLLGTTYGERQPFGESTGYAATVTTEQVDAAIAYQSASYREINYFLRNADALAEDAAFVGTRVTVRNLDAVIDAAPPLPRGITVYRGTNDLTDMAIGTTLTDAGYTSTTINVRTAAEFIRQKDALDVGGAGQGVRRTFRSGQLFRIEVPEGARAGWMQSIGGSSFEQELVLPRGARFRVTGKRTLRRGTVDYNAALAGREPFDEITEYTLEYILP